MAVKTAAYVTRTWCDDASLYLHELEALEVVGTDRVNATEMYTWLSDLMIDARVSLSDLPEQLQVLYREATEQAEMPGPRGVCGAEI